MRRAASNTRATVTTPITQSMRVSSPARKVRSASKYPWYRLNTNPVMPISQAKGLNPWVPSPNQPGLSANTISSTKPTWTARTTWLEMGLKAAV